MNDTFDVLSKSTSGVLNIVSNFSERSLLVLTRSPCQPIEVTRAASALRPRKFVAMAFVSLFSFFSFLFFVSLGLLPRLKVILARESEAFCPITLAFLSETVYDGMHNDSVSRKSEAFCPISPAFSSKSVYDGIHNDNVSRHGNLKPFAPCLPHSDQSIRWNA